MNTYPKYSAKWFFLLPVDFVVFCYGWIREKLSGDSKKSRAEEKAHQAAIRRELRGLPAEHDQEASKP